MSSINENQNEFFIFPAELTEWITKAHEVLPRDLVEHLDSELAAAEQHQDIVPFKTEVQQQLETVGRMQATLSELLKQTEAWAVALARREQYGEKWWQQKRLALSNAFQSDPQIGAAEWLKTFVEALIAWELDICDRLTSESFPLPVEMGDLPPLLRTGLQGIRDGDYEKTLEMLKRLTQGLPFDLLQPVLAGSSWALLFIFMARIYLFLSKNAAALVYFEQAKQWSPEDGRVYAALGDYYRAQHDRDQARSLYQRAIELSSQQPEGYVGMGLLAEDDKNWDEADERYERAIRAVQDQKDIGVALSKLLAPATANLFLELARVLRKQEPKRALQAVEHAIELGIKGGGSYPEWIGYRLKGEILEQIQRPIDAAEAYYEAGRRFGWRNENQIAIDLLTKAKQLNQKHILTYWNLAENLRIASQLSSPPYVNQRLIQQALEVWEAGAKVERPSASESWAYTVRALISEQRAHMLGDQRVDLWWEAVAYAERAIILDANEPYRWAHLARFHRYLNTESTALRVTEKSLEIDSKNAAVLEERAAILANVGQYSEAENIILKRNKLGQNTWMKAVYACVLMHMDKVEAALKLADGVVQESQENLQFREVRAECNRKLGLQDKVAEDYQWIWNRYGRPEYQSIDNQVCFGWAAYRLDKLDEAIDIFEKLAIDPIEAGSAYRKLGLCYFKRGDIQTSQEKFSKGIELAINVREIDDLLDELKILETLSQNSPDLDQLTSALQEIKNRMDARRINLMQPLAPEKELGDRVRELEEKGDKDSWAWIGAQAGLARMYLENGNEDKAASIYSLLTEKGERFFEANIALEKIRTIKNG